ncbi:hypothetical protein ACGFIF_42875 [Kribbella sp. NPDC049174]|uniref:hypothetical protein n=1 Tax=Kribbella sp. NPDC049174 TaxID=3364112 RepID=UPI0037181073
MQGLTIKAEQLGTLRVSYTDEWDYGTTIYEVDGPRVTGVFTIGAEVHAPGEYDIDPDGKRLRVAFGRRRPGETTFWGRKDRPGVPSVNGVELYGCTWVDLATLRTQSLSRRTLPVIHRADPYGPVPDATAQRTALVIDALALHWLGRPENYALRLHAAHAEVGYAVAQHRDALAKARADLEDARARVARFEASTAGAQMFELVPTAPQAMAS